MNLLGDLSIIIKGAGEMASGIAHRLYSANLTRICMTETPAPLAVRRTVSFSEAVYDGRAQVEGVFAELSPKIGDIDACWSRGRIAVLVDPDWECIHGLNPDVVIDAILAKRNLGTNKSDAPLVIGIGPGFTAPNDVHVAIESNRGHHLGRVICAGAPEPNTGIPGQIGGFGLERLLRAPHGGIVRHETFIGATVKKGDVVLRVDGSPVTAAIDGIVRGLIREVHVTSGTKLGDIDPRGDISYCHTISEKARAIAGGVLEAVTGWGSRRIVSMEEGYEQTYKSKRYHRYLHENACDPHREWAAVSIGNR